MAGIYVVANFWVIQWLIQSVLSLSISFDVAQYLKVENMMFNHMQWISRNAETIFYNHMASVIWFLMGYYFDRDRKLTCKFLVAQMIMCYLVPLVMYYIYRGNAVPDWWMKKTIPLICSDAILLFALFYMAMNREAWVRYICPLRKGVRSRKKSHHHGHHSSQSHHGHHSHHSHHSHHHSSETNASQEVEQEAVTKVEGTVVAENSAEETVAEADSKE